MGTMTTRLFDLGQSKLSASQLMSPHIGPCVERGPLRPGVLGMINVHSSGMPLKSFGSSPPLKEFQKKIQYILGNDRYELKIQ